MLEWELAVRHKFSWDVDIPCLVVVLPANVEFSFAFIVDRIISDEPWEDLVPGAVADFVREHRLAQRLKKLYGMRNGTTGLTK